MNNDAYVKRHYNINMPQMALGGLSEAWLFRELGDIHWEMLSAGLGAPSSKLLDANGDRLYATFTCIKMISSVPLLQFCENDEITVEGNISRFGAGVYFGNLIFGNSSQQIEVQLMTSFTKRSSENSNHSLLKGQPIIPAASPIPEIKKLPDLAMDYRRIRGAGGEKSILFECLYDIQPYHDINGVGLLYFAAYPIINDLCEMRNKDIPPSWCMEMSTVSRDIYYFGNCDISDKILYRLHEEKKNDKVTTLVSSLARVSDGMVIAHITTSKTTC
ncbi:MAG: hypothetical protein HQL71_13525 [Magnetococcales bacterium]|nr:hypothetical protein [Magnetococcales bacterium]